jgi:membrane protein required for colicin V production
MNQLDFVILAVVALGAIYGLLRGVLRMATSVVALAAGVYIASIYYPRVAGFAEQWFDLGPAAAAAVGYVVVFVAVFAVVAAVGEAFGRLLHIVRLGWIDRLCGAAVGVAVSGALVGLFLMILTALLPVDAAMLRQSKLTPIMLRYAEILIAYVPDEVKDAYRVKRDELRRLWFEGAPSASPSPGTR